MFNTQTLETTLQSHTQHSSIHIDAIAESLHDIDYKYLNLNFQYLTEIFISW